MLASLMLPPEKSRPDIGGILEYVCRKGGLDGVRSFPSVEPAVCAGADSPLAGSANPQGHSARLVQPVGPRQGHCQLTSTSQGKRDDPLLRSRVPNKLCFEDYLVIGLVLNGLIADLPAQPLPMTH